MKLVINLVLLPEASSASKTIWKSKETSSFCCFFLTHVALGGETMLVSVLFIKTSIFFIGFSSGGIVKYQHLTASTGFSVVLGIF